MVIPWIVGGALLLLVGRWIFVKWRRHETDRAFGAAIRNRNDVKRYLGDNE